MSLHQAAKAGKVPRIRKIIQDGTSVPGLISVEDFVNSTDAYQLTPLHYAVKYQHVEAVEVLLTEGANATIKGESKVTPLHFAARYARTSRIKDGIEIINLLLANGADINAADQESSTPLHYACVKGTAEVVQRLLAAKDIKIDATDRLRATPLHFACSTGSAETVKVLLSHGATVYVKDEANMTPLHIACGSGDLEVVNLLFDNIESVAGFSAVSSSLIDENREQQSPLHMAVMASHYEVAKSLLERGGDTTQVMAENETALHVAAVTGHLDIIKLLITHGGKIEAKNDVGRTPLHKAARFGKHAVIQFLIEREANVNIQDNQMITPLMLAASSGGMKCVEILMENGASTSLKDDEDQTAIHLATEGDALDSLRVICRFLDNAYDIDEKNKEGNTALHLACLHGFDDLARELLASGANPKPRNVDEQTPLHLAALHGRSDVAHEILQRKPSAINDIDKRGNSALHLAAIKGHSLVIDILLSYGAAINDRNTILRTPLDCASYHGHVDCARVLLNEGASVAQLSRELKSPLHLAAREGHADTIHLLLQYCDITTLDESGRNCLDLAVDFGRKDTAATILQHRDWKLAMRNKTVSEGKVTTPMRKMIMKMPEVALIALNQCLHLDPRISHEDPDYQITLDYEFVDDVYREWPCDFVIHGKEKGLFLSKEEIRRQLEKKKNHTLSVMIEYKREEILSHPLVTSLLDWKWTNFAAYVYYSKLFLYLTFLLFLTAYVLYSAPMRAPFRQKDCSLQVDSRASIHLVVFVEVGRYVVLILAIIHILMEIGQLVGQGLDYFDLENAIEWGVYVLAIINVADDMFSFPTEVALVCTTYQKSVGALVLFLSWINLVLFIRKIPKFGIYIVMFLYVVQTFFQFFLVYALLIVAFGLGFHILLIDVEGLKAFHSPWRSLYKTVVMMTGELNFDDVFNSDINQPVVAWIIFFFFVALMTIVLMNLLVGLAVDDIQEVQRQATLNRMTMQIDLALDAEKSLPKQFRRRFIADNQTVYPNRRGNLASRLLQRPELVKSVLQALETDSTPMEDLKSQGKDLTAKTMKMDSRIENVQEKVHKIDELEVQLHDLKETLEKLTVYVRGIKS